MFRIEMQDLERARLRLKEKKSALVVVKNGKVIFETESHGIKGFLEACELFGKELAGSSIADKIVGRAAAFLCVHFQVSAVFAIIISTEGVRVLKDNNVFYQFEKRVPDILNQKRNDICPFEKLALTSAAPEEAYSKLRTRC
ncbi:MAG: DUF1893 domain-containing protein [Candidatus Bathyarchaeota archaeon]|nr:MAG: DUF1893 domain-containing protein [Candidatus Bathyarchaeota archaeon]